MKISLNHLSFFSRRKAKSFFQLEFSVANYRGLAFYINAPISTLALRTKELAIDATYGTNSAGSDLFAVLAEFDGTGVPLAYLFIEKSVENSTPGVPGKMVQILDQFMRPLLHLGFRPSFFNCDKDRSEIKAIGQVWPMAKVQLCYRHALRAVNTMLKDSNKADSLAKYSPGEAVNLIP
ncbi:hypothetical protein K3495_g14577 [Podosphaera aphanis]|nr:hypothetical protein K3495_g14577 [Podosphaera aphanis]